MDKISKDWEMLNLNQVRHRIISICLRQNKRDMFESRLMDIIILQIMAHI